MVRGPVNMTHVNGVHILIRSQFSGSVAMVSLPVRVISDPFSQRRVMKAQMPTDQKAEKVRSSLSNPPLAAAGQGHSYGQ